MKIDSVEFVRSAASARDLPSDGAPELVIVGRSNVGKSTLLNALVRRQVARTSAMPGRTRLINLYRVRPAGHRAFYLVDLPGYGFATGGPGARKTFGDLTRAYFGEGPAMATRPTLAGAVLLVDARHPGLEADLEADRWLQSLGLPVAVVATKTDKLSRAERDRSSRQLVQLFDDRPSTGSGRGELAESRVLLVSAATGEGLDQLWKQISRRIEAAPRR